MPFCMSCGKELAETDKFCLNCGAEQKVDTPSPKSKTEKQEARDESHGDTQKPVSSEEKTDLKPVPKTEESKTEVKKDDVKTSESVSTPTPLPKTDSSSDVPADASSESPTPTPLPTVASETGKSKGKKVKKPRKKKKLGKFIFVLILLGVLGGGGVYAYTQYENSLPEGKVTSAEGFMKYWLEQAGLRKSEDTESQDTQSDEKGAKDTKRDETSSDTKDDTKPTTTPITATDKTFWYDEKGDIVDKNGKQYFLMFENKKYFYEPVGKKIYEASATKLTAKTLDVNVFYSKKYSFMIVFPKAWSKYKSDAETIKDDASGQTITYVTFYLPTKDKNYQNEDGIVPIFTIAVVNKNYYKQIKTEADSDSTYDPGMLLGTFGNYGYLAYSMDGGYPDDVIDRLYEINTILDSSFSFHKLN